MRYGYVDESWAKHHHLRWYEDVVDGRVRAEVRGSEDGAARSVAARDRARLRANAHPHGLKPHVTEGEA